MQIVSACVYVSTWHDQAKKLEGLLADERRTGQPQQHGNGEMLLRTARNDEHDFCEMTCEQTCYVLIESLGERKSDALEKKNVMSAQQRKEAGKRILVSVIGHSVVFHYLSCRTL